MNPALGMTICLFVGFAILALGAGLRVGTAIRRGESLWTAVFGAPDFEHKRAPHTWLLALALCLLLSAAVLGLVLLMS